jgi:hypothetical protein
MGMVMLGMLLLLLAVVLWTVQVHLVLLRMQTGASQEGRQQGLAQVLLLLQL